MQVYHVGLLIHKGVAKLQLRRDVDFLSCEIYEYFGKRETTKREIVKKLHDVKLNAAFLTEILKARPELSTKIKRLAKTID